LWLVAPAALAQEGAARPESLGAGYAQLLNLTLSDDLSSAHYEIDAGEGIDDPLLRITRLPWRIASRKLARGELDWLLELGYLGLDAGFDVSLPGFGGGRIDSRWRAYGATTGVRLRLPLADSLSLEPTLWLGIARLDNDAHYSGIATALRPAVAGTLFDWSTDAAVASADLGLVSRKGWGDLDGWLAARATHSVVDSFGESSAAVRFRENGNTLSLRAELEGPTGCTLAGRSVRWTSLGSYARFLGTNADQLGFNDVAQLGAGLVFVAPAGDFHLRRIAVKGSLLRGSHVRGWSLGFGLRR